MLDHPKNFPECQTNHLHGYVEAKNSWWISRSSTYITRTFATSRANHGHDMCEQNQLKGE